jgi:hypothetical protein
MIYLPAMDYNLPGSFGSDAKFRPRFSNGCCNGKFIIGRIRVIGIIAIVPAPPSVRAMIANPFIAVIEFIIRVTVSRLMSVTVVFIKLFLVLVDFGFVMNRQAIGTAAVTLRLDTLFGPVVLLPAFPVAGPGSAREHKNQRCNHQTDFKKFRFHCLASFVVNLSV